MSELTMDENALRLAIVEMKLHVNRKLYEKGFLTEEIYVKAKEIILKEST